MPAASGHDHDHAGAERQSLLLVVDDYVEFSRAGDDLHQLVAFQVPLPAGIAVEATEKDATITKVADPERCERALDLLLGRVLAPIGQHGKPFDFIFDRGCYHGVRRNNAEGYVATTRQVSRAGTQFLLLAGNANESASPEL